MRYHTGRQRAYMRAQRETLSINERNSFRLMLVSFVSSIFLAPPPADDALSRLVILAN